MCASPEDPCLLYVLWQVNPKVTVHGVSLGKVVPITTVAKATCAHVAKAEMRAPAPSRSNQFQALVFQQPTIAQAEMSCRVTAEELLQILLRCWGRY